MAYSLLGSKVKREKEVRGTQPPCPFTGTSARSWDSFYRTALGSNSIKELNTYQLQATVQEEVGAESLTTQCCPLENKGLLLSWTSEQIELRKVPVRRALAPGLTTWPTRSCFSVRLRVRHRCGRATVILGMEWTEASEGRLWANCLQLELCPPRVVCSVAGPLLLSHRSLGFRRPMAPPAAVSPFPKLCGPNLPVGRKC